jgi:hypothetical protein
MRLTSECERLHARICPTVHRPCTRHTRLRRPCRLRAGVPPAALPSRGQCRDEVRRSGPRMLSSAGTHRHYGAADLPPTSRRPPADLPPTSRRPPADLPPTSRRFPADLPPISRGQRVRTASEQGGGWIGFRGAPRSRAGQARWRRRPGGACGDRGGIGGTLALAPALALSGP